MGWPASSVQFCPTDISVERCGGTWQWPPTGSHKVHLDMHYLGSRRNCISTPWKLEIVDRCCNILCGLSQRGPRGVDCGYHIEEGADPLVANSGFEPLRAQRVVAGKRITFLQELHSFVYPAWI